MDGLRKEKQQRKKSKQAELFLGKVVDAQVVTRADFCFL
jgi:hypothetical protein